MTIFESIEARMKALNVKGLAAELHSISPSEKKELGDFIAAQRESFKGINYRKATDEERHANSVRFFILDMVSNFFDDSLWFGTSYRTQDIEEHYEEALHVFQLKKIKGITDRLLTSIRDKWYNWLPTYPMLRKLYNAGLVEHNIEVMTFILIRTPELVRSINLERMIDMITDEPFDLEVLMGIFKVDVSILRLYSNGIDQKEPWLYIFEVLLERGFLDRIEIAQKIFEAFNNPTLNKQTQSWMKSLYLRLALTKEEEFKFVEDLNNLLNNELTLIASFGVQRLKVLSKADTFDWSAFIEAFQNLTQREKVVGSIKTGLQLLNRHLKTDKEFLVEACLCASNVLIHEDEKLQLLVLQMFNLLEQPNQEVIDAVVIYEISILKSLKEDIYKAVGIEYTESVSEIRQSYSFAFSPPKRITSDKELKVIRDWDDFVFLAGKIIKGNAAEDLELFLEALLHFNTRLPVTFRSDLAAFAKQSKKLYTEPRTNKTVSNTHVLMSALLHFWFTDELDNFKSYRKALEEKGSHIQNERFIDIWHKRLIEIADRLRTKNTLPLLSTPTHGKCWISPNSLLKRLSEYQKAKAAPDKLDFIIAIGRLAYESDQYEVVSSDSEYSDIVVYMLTGKLSVKQIKKLPHFWLHAVRTKRDEAGLNLLIQHLKSIPQKSKHALNLNETFGANIDLPFWELKENYNKYNNKNYFTLEISTKGEMPGNNLNLYGSYVHNTQYAEDSPDAEKLFWLTPNFPDPFLAYIIKNNLKYCNWDEVQEARNVQKTTEALLELNCVLGEFGHLFLACAFSHRDKTIRATGLELIFNYLEAQALKLSLFTHALAKLIKVDYFPAKRLVAQLIALRSMSPYSDDLIIKTMEAMILELDPNALPKSLKNLLELYYDVLYGLNEKPSSEIISILAKWKGVGAVKTAVGKLLNPDYVIENREC